MRPSVSGNSLSSHWLILQFSITKHGDTQDLFRQITDLTRFLLVGFPAPVSRSEHYQSCPISDTQFVTRCEYLLLIGQLRIIILLILFRFVSTLKAQTRVRIPLGPPTHFLQPKIGLSNQ